MRRAFTIAHMSSEIGIKACICPWLMMSKGDGRSLKEWIIIQR